MKKINVLIKIVIICLFSSISTIRCFGGEDVSNFLGIPKVVPPSPEAMAFNRYIEWPVDLYSGIPQISIPIHTIKVDDFTLPISLSYHAGGVKVQDVATRVGLGWVINAGGQISCTVKGLPDNKGYTDFLSKWSNENSTSSEDMDDLALLFTSYNWEPDVNYFSIPGASGRFFYNTDGEIVCVPKTDMKIEYESGKYIITDDKGNVYEFEEFEETVCYSVMLDEDLDVIANSRTNLYSAGLNSRALLTKITLKSGKEIKFVYQHEEWGGSDDEDRLRTRSGYINNEKASYYMDSWFDINRRNDEISYIETRYKSMPVLDSIITDKEIIKFHSEEYRCDLPDATYLSSIDIVDRFTEDVVKTYNLDYYYTGRSTEYELDELDASDITIEDSYKYRLMLRSVQEEGKNPYSFKYFNDKYLPNRIYSFDYDKYGFYNGDWDTPPLSHYYDYTTEEAVSDPDRVEPVLEYARTGTLYQITYPTKGISTFNYDLHEVSNGGSAAGLRLESVEYSPNDGGNDIVKSYEYSSGIVSNKIPGYSQCTHKVSYVGTNDAGVYSCVSTYYGYLRYCHYMNYAPESYPTGNDGGRAGYGEVREIMTDGDEEIKTVYTYTTARDYPDTYERDIINGGDCSAQSDEDNGQTPPFNPVNDLSWARGLMLSKEVYRGSDIIESTTNNYDVFYAPDDEFYEEVVGYNLFWKTKGGNFDPFNSAMMTQMPRINDNCCMSVGYKDYVFTTGVKRLNTSVFEKDGVVTETSYTYGDNSILKPTEIKKTTSEGGTENTYYTYPEDITDISSSVPDVIDELVEKNYIVPVLTTQTSVNDDDDEIVINAVYAEFMEKILKPVTVYQYTASSSRSSVSMTSGFEISSSGITPPSYMSEAVEYIYDTVGNIIQFKKADDYPTSFLWGYNNTLPIAQVVNADTGEFYYTGFEDDPYIYTWHDGYSFATDKSFTGDKSFKIVNSTSVGTYFFTKFLPVDLSVATTFYYSCWVYSNGPDAMLYFFHRPNNDSVDPYDDYTAENVSTSSLNQWVFLEGTITVPNTAKSIFLRMDNNGGGSVWFDDLRIRPANSQMKTFTYKPLVGVTSVLDENNYKTIYTYDDYGRLIQVTDKDGYIINEYEYNYR